MPVPALPLELTQLIVALAVPPPSFDLLGQQRQRTLARCARVCKGWLWAQEVLYGEVLLADVGQIKLFARTLRDDKRDRRATLASQVRVLRIGTEWDMREWYAPAVKRDIVDILRRCRRLHSLFIYRADDLELNDTLQQLDSLRSLHVAGCSTVGPVTPALWLRGAPSDGRTFSHISYASTSAIDDVGLPPEICLLFDYRPTALKVDCLPPIQRIAKDAPHLRYLAVSHFNRPAVVIPGPVSPSLAALASSELIFLSCPAGALRTFDHANPLSHLPSTLRSLRLTSGHFFGNDFLTPFLASPDNTLSALEELILPMRLSTGLAFEALRSWAAQKGVRIVWEKDEEGQGTLHDELFWCAVQRWEKKIEMEEREWAAQAAAKV
ncbi:hypothetical protein JCM10207_000868 [Rhodosporidiobolus poonsookiae]